MNKLYYITTCAVGNNITLNRDQAFAADVSDDGNKSGGKACTDKRKNQRGGLEENQIEMCKHVKHK